MRRDRADVFLPPLLFLLGYAAALAWPPRLLGDADTYWHVATGGWILAHGAVPHTDPFSATMPGAPWVDHEWLSEVLLALAWRAGGWPGVAALGAAVFGLALALLAARLLRSLPLLAVCALTVLAGISAARDLSARPHLLALPLLVLWTAEMARARAEDRPPRWRFLPLMAVWANLHGGFILGLNLIPPLALEAWWAGASRRLLAGWAGFGVLAVGAALLTPNGAAGLLHPFAMARMPVMAGIIEEWESPDFHRLQPLEIWLLAALPFVLLRGARLPPVRAVLLLGLLHAALGWRRNAVLLGFMAPLLVADALETSWHRSDAPRPAPRRAGIAWLAAGLAAAALSSVLLPGLRPDSWNTPEAAVAAVPERVRATPVLNEYDFGGYLIFAGLRPFVDGRADMYGDPFLAEYQRALRPDLRVLDRLLRRYDVGWTLLRTGDPTAALLDALPGWQRLHTDGIAVVHARTALLAPP